MNEKLVAGMVTAAGIAPLCAVCVLGPAAIGSALAGAFAWLGGAGPSLTVAVMAATGLLVYRTVRRRHKPIATPRDDRSAPRLPTMENSEAEALGAVSGVRSAQQGERS